MTNELIKMNGQWRIEIFNNSLFNWSKMNTLAAIHNNNKTFHCDSLFIDTLIANKHENCV